MFIDIKQKRSVAGNFYPAGAECPIGYLSFSRSVFRLIPKISAALVLLP